WLANGQVVAWFQGRMEWGARALGHRSILADPTRLESRQRINESVKRREDFRPFAPAVLQEEVANWFHLEGTSPFMTEVASIRSDQLDRVPAIRHVDGTARVQTVDRVHQPLFHKLIRAFCDCEAVSMRS
ncbi:MAG: carbamoyltransferase C-terminal domain-containing protein, partial [Polyangiaceae bacterium]